MEQALRNFQKLVFASKDGELSVEVVFSENLFYVATITQNRPENATQHSYASYEALLQGDHPYDLSKFHLEPWTEDDYEAWGEEE